MNTILQTPTVAAIATLLAAAGLLLLHRLRVQPVRRPVATLLFWQSVAREQSSRSLWGRFSHFRTFLLLLAVILLLGLALSGLQGPVGSEATTPLVIVIDSSFSMSAQGSDGRTRTAEALALAGADVSKAGDRPLAIVEAGDVPRVLASFQDPKVVARRVLELVRPTTQPANRAAAIRLAASLLPLSGKRQIVFYTDRPLPREPFPRSTDEALRVRTVGESLPNSAILSAVYESDVSRSETGALVVRMKTWGEPRGAFRVQVTLVAGAVREVLDREATPGEDGESVASFGGLAADGRVADVELIGADAVSADDRTSIRLPLRPPVRFDVTGTIPPALMAALSTIGRDEIGATTTIGVQRSSNYPAGKADRPEIMVFDGGAPSTIVGGDRILPADDFWTTGLSMEGAVAGRGIDLRSISPTATPLLRAGDAVVAAVERGDGVTRLLLSDALFADRSTLPRRPGFVIFLGRVARSIAGWTESPLSLPIERRIKDPIWHGDSTIDNVALVSGDRNASDVAIVDRSREESPAAAASTGVVPDLSLAALLGAIGLLTAEGLLYATKRIV